MKRLAVLMLALLFVCAQGLSEGRVTMGVLLLDLVNAFETPAPDDLDRIDADVEALDDDVARSIAEHWKRVYLDENYRLLISGQDDPSLLALPDEGEGHAFVVLGYELKDGEMTDELKRRCDAAAEAARAYPRAILVCTGGATGVNNPDGHTEGGLMKAYLTQVCGLDEGRIFTDEKAMNTAQNALNTFEIMKERGTATMTIVTSAYHQKWGQVLYNGVGAVNAQNGGFCPAIVGNFCCDVEPSVELFRKGDQFAAYQMARILDLPESDIDLLPDIWGEYLAYIMGQS